MSNLEIRNLTRDKIETKFLKEVAEKVFTFLKIKKLENLYQGGQEEISLVIIGDTQMKGLNKKYRQKDKTTDVLTFDYGEIFICLPQADRQAKERRHSLKKELATLLIHGILHLTGYNDEQENDRAKMLDKQEEILKKVT